MELCPRWQHNPLKHRSSHLDWNGRHSNGTLAFLRVKLNKSQHTETTTAIGVWKQVHSFLSLYMFLYLRYRTFQKG